ncbi:MAG: thiamine-phosphate diphosphorylase [Bacteroidetes bacterium GWD2_45_23]|nr:MAG: thiamine-phosphate diphosphorylase [Bacteroidetes bacterium GWC2_46_850]OFX85588.1 MAG: thiamine-phosphate diphosphorylase [Bacteroidetes bacterium GWD2_45_23]HAR38886.1 thiamine phosphate synthase [Porphyromonadaceae bacterium]HBB00821.1 thiamine phosphate synthase [Porphyromonadaceae bacterium]HCC19446.1 thiamine phosphate synthase [Porphyromonadaceae bacterium]
MNDFDLSLYLVTDRSLSGGRELEYIVGEAVSGGVTMVQLREKHCSSREFYRLAVQLKRCLAPWRVPLIINDRLDIALACDADGLHLGQSDLPCGIARKILGKNKIIGLSVENVMDVTEANREEVDYIGISPVFSTPTKIDTAPELGLEGIREIASMARCPSVAIGGINIRNAQSVLAAGADGISVVSAIMSAPDPRLAASELIQVVNQSRKQNNNRVV